MVLAVRFKTDVAQQDHFVIAGDLFEGAFKIFAWVFEIAGEPLFIGAYYTRRRAAQALTVRVVTRPLNERADGIFGRGSRRALVTVDGGVLCAALRCHDALMPSEIRWISSIPIMKTIRVIGWI